jgi:hypothetical protein
LLAAKVPVATDPLALRIMTVAAVAQALDSLMAAMQRQPSQRNLSPRKLVKTITLKGQLILIASKAITHWSTGA